jgi:anti-sigma B factor antagonist
VTATGSGEHSPPLEVTVQQQGRWTVLQLAGELDYLTCDLLAPFLQQATSAAARPRVAVDVSGLRFCDSAGIACMFNASRRIRSKGGELTVVDAGPLRLRDKAWMRGLGGRLPVVTELPA